MSEGEQSQEISFQELASKFADVQETESEVGIRAQLFALEVALTTLLSAGASESRSIVIRVLQDLATKFDEENGRLLIDKKNPIETRLHHFVLSLRHLAEMITEHSKR